MLCWFAALGFSHIELNDAGDDRTEKIFEM